MDLLTLLLLASTIVESFAFASGAACKDCIRRNVARDRVCELESSQVYQPCRCDADCELYRDCCPSTDDGCLSSRRAGEENLPRFRCQTVVLRERKNGLPAIKEQYWMVSSCSSEWMEENRMTVDVPSIQSHCRSTNIISTNVPPVTDQASGIVYRNKYCALCNGVNTLKFVAWDYSFKCLPKLLVRNLLDDGNYTLTEDDFNRYCKIDRFAEPSLPGLTTPARQCYPQIDTCLELSALLSLDKTNLWNSTYYNDVKNLCIQGHFQHHIKRRSNELNTISKRILCSL